MPDRPAPSLRELANASVRIGCLGFGGPAGQIALMRRVFIEEKSWITDDEYQHGLGFCMLLPGPEAQQLATYVGWRLRGVWGALIAGWLFVLPGAAIVFALSWLYVVAGALPVVAALFDGVKCAVVALVIEALIKIGNRALKTKLALWIAIATFLALMLGAPFPLVILAAGVLGAILAAPQAAAPVADHSARGTWRTALVWLVLWLAPLGVAALMLGPHDVLVRVGALFSVLACVTFGGAYALLAYLTTEAASQGWLTPAQMIDGLGLAETTPGPLILVNEFVGFLAGWGQGGLAAAIACALMALWCTFVPSFVWIFAAAPYVERLRHDVRAAGALAAITAAVLGVIAKLALFFAGHVLFAAQTRLPLGFGLAALEVPDVATPNWSLIVLSAAATFAQIRLKAPLLALIGACAAAGWALHALALT